MSFRRIPVVPLLIFLMAVSLPAAEQSSSASAPRIYLGVFPVLDLSGETFGETFAQQLTTMIFNELQDHSGIQPVLLNPGGLYVTPLDDWIVEYGRAAEVDVVLITSLMRTERPKKGDWILRVESQLVEMQTGNRSSKLAFSESINKREVRAGLEYGTTAHEARAIDRQRAQGMAPIDRMLMGSSHAPSREFEKQPLGKAARKMARAAREHVRVEATSMVPKPSGSTPVFAQGTCPILFRVLYVHKKAASKAYQVTLNEREESLGIQDGVVQTSLPNGPVFVQVSVADAPYRLPVQRVYQASTFLDCSRPERTLALEIGGGGEAFLRWKP
ncbi:MAG: hypothetical protein ACRD2Q_03345 [Terriglobales bacterium]